MVVYSQSLEANLKLFVHVCYTLYVLWPIGFNGDITFTLIMSPISPSFTLTRKAILITLHGYTVYPKKYAHGFCFAVLCCGYTLTDFPISIRLTSLALWQSNDCPSASKATLMNMDKYFMWIHYERLRNHNKAKHNKTVCTFLGIYCKYPSYCVITTLLFQDKELIHHWSPLATFEARASVFL